MRGYSQTTCPANISVCYQSAPLELTGGSPEGGTYSGSGVSDGFFYPANVNSGSHLITYSYTNKNSVLSTCTFTITVSDKIFESCPLSIGFVCVEMTSYKLWGCSTTRETTATFSGDWVQDGKFYPSLAGIGDHSYTINYTDAAGCSLVSGGVARVIAGVPPLIECPADISVPSISVLPFEITGGSSVPMTSTPSYTISDYYTGSGMADSKTFSTAKAGNGVHLLTYTVEKFHYLSDICFSQCNFNVNVGKLPVTLIHFEAKSKENEIGLSWETSPMFTKLIQSKDKS